LDAKIYVNIAILTAVFVFEVFDLISEMKRSLLDLSTLVGVALIFTDIVILMQGRDAFVGAVPDAFVLIWPTVSFGLAPLLVTRAARRVAAHF
jgi:hypothetical protein